MNIDDKVIKKLERLSMLQLSQNERQELKGELSKMIEMIDKLSEFDTVNQETFTYVDDQVQQLRPDEQKDTLSKDQALKNAPHHINGYFTVPKVIKEQNEQ